MGSFSYIQGAELSTYKELASQYVDFDKARTEYFRTLRAEVGALHSALEKVLELGDGRTGASTQYLSLGFLDGSSFSPSATADLPVNEEELGIDFAFQLILEKSPGAYPQMAIHIEGVASFFEGCLVFSLNQGANKYYVDIEGGEGRNLEVAKAITGRFKDVFSPDIFKIDRRKA